MRDLSELLEIEDIYEAPPFRLTDDVYIFRHEVYGNNVGEENAYTIGTVDFVVNGKKREVETVYNFDNYENEGKITDKEFFQYVSAKFPSIRAGKHQGMIIGTVLYEFNQLSDLTFKNEEYKDWEHVRKLQFNIDRFSFDFTFVKESKRISLDMCQDGFFRFALNNNNTNHYDTLIEQIKEHNQLRLYFVTAS